MSKTTDQASDPQFWYDGAMYRGDQIRVSVDEPGLLYGATVFTTLRIYGQSLDHPLTAWAAHCDRLRHSLNDLGWRSPHWSRVRQGVLHLSEGYAVLRVTLFPSGVELITGRALPEGLAQVQQDGIVAWVAREEESGGAGLGGYGRAIAPHKTGNYLPAWLARQAAQRRGAEDAILVDPTTGHWLETSTGNLWGWADGTWWTPPLHDPSSPTSSILPGIVRSHVLEMLQAQGAPAREVAWGQSLWSRLETLAYSNSVRQVVPIHTVMAGSRESCGDDWVGGQHRFNPHHPRLRQLQQLFQERLNELA